MDRLYVLFFTAYLVVVIHGFGGWYILKMPPLIQSEEGADTTVQCQVKDTHFKKPVSPCQAGTSFSWLWNGSTIASCRPAEVLEGFRFDDTSGELTILNVQRSMNGTRLTCRAVDEDAVETQMSTSLAVISAKFSILEVLERDEAVIECRAAAKHGNVCTSDGPDAEWSVGDSSIASCSHQVTNLSGTIDNQTWALVIPNVPLSMNGTTFTCKVFKYGYDKNTVEVIVRKRILVIETGLSEDVGVRWGDTTLKCLVNSVPKAFPRLKFKWLHDGISYDSCKTSGAEDSQKYEFHHDWKSCNLTIRHLDFADEGNYSCQVSESYITQSSRIFLTVNVDPDAVYILNSSSKDFLRGDVFIPTGTTHNFTCLATDTKPPAQIIWSFDGKDTSETTSVIGANLYNTSSALVVSSIQKGQHLNFTCTAIGLKKNASFTIRLIGQQRAATFQEPTGQAKSTLISIAIGVTALLLLAVIIGIVFWKKRKPYTLTEANEPVVRFRRTESPRPTVPVSSALNTVVGASGDTLRNTNRPVEVRFRRTSTDSLIVPVSSAHYQTTIGSPGNPG